MEGSLETGVSVRRGLMIPVLLMCSFSSRHIDHGVRGTPDATVPMMSRQYLELLDDLASSRCFPINSMATARDPLHRATLLLESVSQSSWMTCTAQGIGKLVP